MPLVVILALFWLFLAFRAFSRGDTSMAVAFIVVGTALTAYRVKRLRDRQK
jgi:hypothetical protein